MTSGSVVPKPQPLTEEDFHNRLMADFNRLERRWKPAKLALHLGLSVRQLGNIKNGATLHPQPHRLFNLFAEDADALHDVLAEYRLRTVPIDALCSSDPGTLPLAVLLHHVAEAEHPESHGGAEITKFEADKIPDEVLAAAQRVIDRVRALKATSRIGQQDLRA